jgi:hypothetical protein
MTNKDRHHTLTYHHMRKLFIGLWLLGATVCQGQTILRISMTGLSFGDRMKALSREIPNMSFSAHR